MQNFTKLNYLNQKTKTNQNIKALFTKQRVYIYRIPTHKIY